MSVCVCLFWGLLLAELGEYWEHKSSVCLLRAVTLQLAIAHQLYSSSSPSSSSSLISLSQLERFLNTCFTRFMSYPHRNHRNAGTYPNKRHKTDHLDSSSSSSAVLLDSPNDSTTNNPTAKPDNQRSRAHSEGLLEGSDYIYRHLPSVVKEAISTSVLLYLSLYVYIYIYI